MLKKILIAVGILLLVFVLVGLLLPQEMSVSRSIVVAAEPAEILPHVATPRAWPKWAVWNREMDPTLEQAFSGPASGPGARWSWQGDDLGEGWLELTKADATGIEYDMSFFGGEPFPNEMTFTREGEGTKVTWSFEHEVGMPVVGGYLRPMIESSLADQFDTGLESLRLRVESGDTSLHED